MDSHNLTCCRRAELEARRQREEGERKRVEEERRKKQEQEEAEQRKKREQEEADRKLAIQLEDEAYAMKYVMNTRIRLSMGLENGVYHRKPNFWHHPLLKALDNHPENHSIHVGIIEEEFEEEF